MEKQLNAGSASEVCLCWSKGLRGKEFDSGSVLYENEKISVYIFCGKLSTKSPQMQKWGLIMLKLLVERILQNKCATQTFKYLWNILVDVWSRAQVVRMI